MIEQMFSVWGRRCIGSLCWRWPKDRGPLSIHSKMHYGLPAARDCWAQTTTQSSPDWLATAEDHSPQVATQQWHLPPTLSRGFQKRVFFLANCKCISFSVQTLKLISTPSRASLWMQELPWVLLFFCETLSRDCGTLQMPICRCLSICSCWHMPSILGLRSLTAPIGYLSEPMATKCPRISQILPPD